MKILLLMPCMAAFLGCDYPVPTRSNYTRVLPDRDAAATVFDGGATDGAGPDAAEPVVAWRATSLLVAKPEALMTFQEGLITPAVDRENLNLMVVQEGANLGEGTWALRIGTGERQAPGRFAFSVQYPPAIASVVVDSARTISTPGDLEFTLVAKLRYVVPMPIRSARLTAQVAADGSGLMTGRLTGVILGEEATTTLVDTQNDMNPSNDGTLDIILGAPDLDLDGDGTVDDYAVDATFIAARVELVQ